LARKILLADDSVTAQNMGRKILTDAGYEVVAVNNGSAALKKIAEHKPDLIVLDVYMPGYSGLEVCQRIKENRETARIPVLLTVGKLEPFKPEEARRARADAFVVKPFEASELLSALTKLEEKIVPQAENKPGRLAKALAAIEEPSEEKFGDKDEGWKSRLRFPSRKNKASEPAEEIPASSTLGGKSLRDSLPTEAPSAHAEKPMAASAPAEFERPMPAGLPHDITPEEIAAITAAAAQVSGGAAVPSASADKTHERPAEVSASGTSVAEAVAESAVARESSEHNKQGATVAPESEAGQTVEVQVVEAAKEEQAAAPMVSEAVLPVMPVVEAAEEPAPMTFASAHGPESEDISKDDASAQPVSTIPEMPASAPQPEPLEVKASAEDLAERVTDSAESKTLSVDSERVTAPEPIIPPQPAAEVAQASTPAVDVAARAPEEIPTAPVPEAEAPVMVQDIQLSPVEPAFEPADRAEVLPEASPEPVAAVRAPEPAVPTHDEDVMAALQTLIPTPAPGAATVSAIAEDAANRVAAASNELAFVGTSNGRGRWIAEEVTLTAEESAISLEQEMEKAYAAFAASEAARLLASAALDTFPGTQPVVPEAAAAVIDLAASAVSEVAVSPVAESTSSEVNAPAVPDTAAVSAMATAAGAGEPGSSSTIVPPAGSVEDSSPAAASAVPEPTMAAATAAERIDLAEPTIAQSDSPTEETDPAGGMDEMGKNSEGFGFKMIRQSPAAGAKGASKAEPVSKENLEPAAAEEPAAMAAAAAAESAPAVASTSASTPPAAAPTDPKAIASIVDSVLAELRPKIVEEIAKKLSGDGKKE
jgi:CheY-like chemotaxis protein